MDRRDKTKRTGESNEYPWSSDDDDHDETPLNLADLSQRQAQLPTSTEMLGNSSETPSPSSPTSNATSARGAANRYHRDVYWSLVSQARQNYCSAESRAPGSGRLTWAEHREFEMLREIEAERRRETRPQRSEARPERSLSADVQRIIAFKHFTRTMNAMRPNRPTSSSYPVYSSRSSGPSRNPLFSQIAAEGPFPVKSNRIGVSKRGMPNRPVLCFNRTGRSAASSASAPDSNEPQASTSGTSQRPSDAAAPPLDHQLTFNIVQTDDDDDDDMDVTRPLQPEVPPEVEVTEQENMEIAEAPEAAGDAASEPPPAPAPPDVVDAPEQENGNVPEVAATSTQQNEVRREEPEERTEPISVVEFNLSLLRLLECPVCLEWMEPPIAQCRRGHLVCVRCRARLAACPVCRTAFSSVRNRAMEGVAELLRYPCRHGCGREVRLRRREPHEASCARRKYQCPAPACDRKGPLPHQDLALHFQSKHLDILKIGRKHTFSMKVTTEHHDDWLIMALHELFHLRVDIDVRSWGIVVYVAYIGPKCNAKNFTYEITIIGQHNSRKLVYARSTHSDLESSSVNVSRQDCFHLTLDQALNFLRFKNRHCEPDKYLDFNVEITRNEVPEPKEGAPDT